MKELDAACCPHVWLKTTSILEDRAFVNLHCRESRFFPRCFLTADSTDVTDLHRVFLSTSSAAGEHRRHDRSSAGFSVNFVRGWCAPRTWQIFTEFLCQLRSRLVDCADVTDLHRVFLPTSSAAGGLRGRDRSSPGFSANLVHGWWTAPTRQIFTEFLCQLRPQPWMCSTARAEVPDLRPF